MNRRELLNTLNKQMKMYVNKINELFSDFSDSFIILLEYGYSYNI